MKYLMTFRSDSRLEFTDLHPEFFRCAGRKVGKQDRAKPGMTIEDAVLPVLIFEGFLGVHELPVVEVATVLRA